MLQVPEGAAYHHCRKSKKKSKILVLRSNDSKVGITLLWHVTGTTELFTLDIIANNF